MELYNRHRPKTLAEVVGQDDAVKNLKGLIANGGIPKAMLFTGESGTGKTTLARILVTKLNCHRDDFADVNAAESRGIDTVREFARTLWIQPKWDAKVWLIDEVACFTSDAQKAMLKHLEDAPPRVWWLLCTTDPQKLIPPIKTRCTPIQLEKIPNHVICKLVQDVSAKELPDEPDRWPSDEVVRKIAEVANGSARQALVYLELILPLTTDEERLNQIKPPEVERQAIELARALLWQEAPTWKKLRQILIQVTEDPEKIRATLRTSAGNDLLKHDSPNTRAVAVLQHTNELWKDRNAMVEAVVRICSAK